MSSPAATTAPSTSRLDGKIALITGSSRGMGRQNALELASRGASIIITYTTSLSAATSLIAEIESLNSRAIALKADVSNPAEIVTLFEQAVAHFGKLDIVVSNAGVESFGHVSEISVEEFERVFSVNTRGQLLVAKEAYRWLEVGGRLVLMSSISAQAKGVRNHAVYSGSKAAVEAFARCLAVDFGDKKITVNAIAPGGIKTDMYDQVVRKYIPGERNMSDEEIEEIAASWSPLNRPGYPEDVSRVVAFLCSQDAGWMNGQVLTIGGGAAL